MSLKTIAVSRNEVAITTPWNGCWRVEVNKKPVADWSSKADAEADARRRGWRGNGEAQGAQTPMTNERSRSVCFVNEARTIMQSLGPTQRLAFA